MPIYDAYGNVMEYRAADGSLAAAYVYDSFGRTISQTGSLTDVFRYRYSTKSYERESGLYYYDKRFYSIGLRCWLTRDPMFEAGGLALYQFLGNSPLGHVDPYGESVFILKHSPGLPPTGGWTTKYSEAETCFRPLYYEIVEHQAVSGKIAFDVKLMPEFMRVDVYFNHSENSSIAMHYENDHIAIAIKMDVAAQLPKQNVESIFDCQVPARKEKDRCEGVYWSTIQKLTEENNALDAKGGKHDLHL